MGKPNPKKDTTSGQNLDSLQRSSRIVLDFRGYFITFCEKHGEPVHYKGRLLFPDGWTYSSTQYEGPEFPPPSDVGELDNLVEKYWRLRQSTLKKMLDKIRHERKQIQDAQATRDVPLQRMVTREHDGKRMRMYEPVNLKMLDQKIEWIENDLIECHEQLETIKEHKGKKRLI